MRRPMSKMQRGVLQHFLLYCLGRWFGGLGYVLERQKFIVSEVAAKCSGCGFNTACGGL